MKMLWVFLISIFTVTAAYSGLSEFRVFTDQQGRAVEARILNVDTARDLVELQLGNRQRKKVKPSVFSEKDQAFIREWNVCNTFMKSSGLQFSSEKKVIEDWSEEPAKGVNREFEKNVYNCVLKNSSSVAFENIQVEYCVYWEQEVGEESGERREELDHSGRYEIPRLEPRSTASFQTDPVVLVYQYLQGGFYYKNGATGKQSSKMKGVWIKVSMMTSGGETVTREFCEPSSVIKHQVWKAPAEPRTEPAPPSKKKKRKKNKQK